MIRQAKFLACCSEGGHYFNSFSSISKVGGQRQNIYKLGGGLRWIIQYRDLIGINQSSWYYTLGLEDTGDKCFEVSFRNVNSCMSQVLWEGAVYADRWKLFK